MIVNDIDQDHADKNCHVLRHHAIPEIEAFEGDTITLPCEVERPASPLVWAIYAYPVIFHPNGTLVAPYRGIINLSTLHEPLHQHANASNLVITNATIKNNGDYECITYSLDEKCTDLRAKTKVTIKEKIRIPVVDYQQQAELATNIQASTGTSSDDQYKLMDLNNQRTLTRADLLQLAKTGTKQLQQSEQEKNSRRDTNSLLTRLTAPSDSGYLSSSSYSNFPSAFTSPHASASSFNKQPRPFFIGSSTSASSASGLSASPITVASTSSASAHLHHNHQQSSFNGSSRSGLTIFLATTWPYALVLVALTLMMINLYLIVSLVKLQRRKKKRSSQQERQQRQQNQPAGGVRIPQEQQSRQGYKNQHRRDQTDCSI